MTEQAQNAATALAVSDLRSVRIADVTSTRDTVVSLEHNTSIGEAMKTLAQAGILSAPVFISPDLEDLGTVHDETSQKELLGWVDMNDILHAFLHHLEDKHPEKMAMLQLMNLLESEGPAFTSKPLITVMGGQDKSLLYTGESETGLLTAIRKKFLQDGRSRPIHRIGIFNNRGEVEKVVSQMDVLRFLVAHAALFGSLKDQTLFSAGLLDGDRAIAAVDINSSTLLALQHMHTQGHSSVAVLSPEERLVANLSSSDLRYIQADHLSVLALPVGEFLGLLHQAVYLGYTSSAAGMSEHRFFAKAHERQPVPLITCKADTLILDAMQRMVDKGVHRIYVVDDDTSQLPNPLAIITPTDLLRLISQRLSDSTQFA